MPTTADLHLQQSLGFAPLRPKPPRHPVGIYPSEIGSCERKVTLRLMGMKPAERGDGERSVMDFGIIFEEYIAALWRGSYSGKIERQVPVRTPIGNGYIDLYLPEIPKIIEVKSTNFARAEYLPNQSHIDQLLMYMAFFDDPGHYTSTPAELVYGFSDNKDQIKSFVIQYDEKRVEELLAWAAGVEVAVVARKAPRIPDAYDPTRFPCRWGGAHAGQCGFFSYCWQEVK